ncbi:MAG TPA: M13 family metallopeptidase N-terminal domain-containing protein, partial [Telluria sp.]|nr:M13 family metallopeptidase N-terminal domain-containing protein [Telluria sp.]
MKTSWTPIKTAITLAFVGAAVAFGPAGAQQAAKPAAEKQANMTVLPGDDFFRYANNDWLNKTEIPADRSGWGAMGQLAEETNDRIARLIESLAADKATTGEARKVADFYSAYMN